MKDKIRKTKRTKPQGVRFDIDFLEKIKKDKQLTTTQSVADFLARLYEEVYHPLVPNPVMERQVVSVFDPEVLKNAPKATTTFTTAPNKTIPAPKTEKQGKSTPKDEKPSDGPEINPRIAEIESDLKWWRAQTKMKGMGDTAFKNKRDAKIDLLIQELATLI